MVLRNGWNLISLPITPLDVRGELLFGNKKNGSAWELSGRQYVIRRELKAGRAYWVYRPGPPEEPPVVVNVPGKPVENNTIPLLPGWNMIGPVGVPPFGAVPLPLTTTPANAITGPIWGWNGTQYVRATELVCGQGYLVLSSGNATVTNAKEPSR